MSVFPFLYMNQEHTEHHQCSSRDADKCEVQTRPIFITSDDDFRRLLRGFGRYLYGLTLVIQILMYSNQVVLQVIQLLEYDKCLSLQAVGVQN